MGLTKEDLDVILIFTICTASIITLVLLGGSG